ncbi:LuxR C-terminal-related transcriptional regulator [Sphingomicrobium sediminis]|uniref:LuxR C-terminal-related transcriptional regulator n=1 Tax=Sphingomicrobium sediminis TaxID=2950949 RepID=A0A9X2EKK0_9SPHN|nr:LuxR C-terminal-related transcriptional regulator [Sphingomicrobium sediminis]MCM8557329.1 LuxR C-terminal-related transcriptional regulator [Sphingomicrobium sediminis]
MAGADPAALLSEKEKEALRLLIAGHDAKSSARTLGVSHHAINDRLRSARRKLEVTSSREAALLLSEAEQADPEPLVHKPLGDVVAGAGDDDRSMAGQEERGTSRFVRYRKGLIFMSITILAAAGAIFVSTIAEAPRQEDADAAVPVASQGLAGQAESAAEATAFMALVDAGDAEASYAAASETFRDAYTFKLWDFGVSLRALQGGVFQRVLTKVERPTDGVEILYYETEMLSGEKKAERIFMERVGSGWKVANVTITDLGAE